MCLSLPELRVRQIALYQLTRTLETVFNLLFQCLDSDHMDAARFVIQGMLPVPNNTQARGAPTVKQDLRQPSERHLVGILP